MRLYGDADDGLRLDPRECDIKGEKKYENCNCSIEEENACRTSEYKCVERKCRNSVCSKFACAVTPASQPAGASCECGGGGVSCTQYACENAKCGQRVCVAWSVAPCESCPPKEGEPGGPACSARCSTNKDCGGYQVSKTETVSNDAKTCSVTCNIECSTTPNPCPPGSSTTATCGASENKVAVGTSGNDTCYECQSKCSKCSCEKGTLMGSSERCPYIEATPKNCDSACNKKCCYEEIESKGVCTCDDPVGACRGKDPGDSTSCSGKWSLSGGSCSEPFTCR